MAGELVREALFAAQTAFYDLGGIDFQSPALALLATRYVDDIANLIARLGVKVPQGNACRLRLHQGDQDLSISDWLFHVVPHQQAKAWAREAGVSDTSRRFMAVFAMLDRRNFPRRMLEEWLYFERMQREAKAYVIAENKRLKILTDLQQLILHLAAQLPAAPKEAPSRDSYLFSFERPPRKLEVTVRRCYQLGRDGNRYAAKLWGQAESDLFIFETGDSGRSRIALAPAPDVLTVGVDLLRQAINSVPSEPLGPAELQLSIFDEKFQSDEVMCLLAEATGATWRQGNFRFGDAGRMQRTLFYAARITCAVRGEDMAMWRTGTWVSVPHHRGDSQGAAADALVLARALDAGEGSAEVYARGNLLDASRWPAASEQIQSMERSYPDPGTSPWHHTVKTAMRMFREALESRNEKSKRERHHEAACVLFSILPELFRRRDTVGGQEVIDELIQLWSAPSEAPEILQFGLLHMAALWIDAPFYQARQYSLHLIRVHASNAGTTALSYLPDSESLAKSLISVLGKPVFVHATALWRRALDGDVIYSPFDHLSGVVEILDFAINQRMWTQVKAHSKAKALVEEASPPDLYDFVFCVDHGSNRSAAASFIEQRQFQAVADLVRDHIAAKLSKWHASISVDEVDVIRLSDATKSTWIGSWGWPEVTKAPELRIVE